MNKQYSKKTLSIFAALLMISIAIPMTTLATASAHTPAWEFESYAYISVAPSPVGVGQTAYIFCWVDLPVQGAQITNDIRRHDYNLIITAPDGTNTTKHWDVVDDTTGVQAYAFTPEQTGNYTATFRYGGQVHTWLPVVTPQNPNPENYTGDIYKPATVMKTFAVTEEQVAPVSQGAALPTEYWTRPINGQNSNWYTIASNWLNAPYIRSGATSTGGAGYGRYQAFGSAPDTQHVMWTKVLQYGGVVGGENTKNEGEGYYTGSSYNPRFANAIIMQGTLFYQEPYGNSGSGGDYVAVNLRTGEELWRIDEADLTAAGVPSFGYLYGYEDGNQHGVLPNGLLISSVNRAPQGAPANNTWRGYDPLTGELTGYNIYNVPSGSAASATLAANSATGASGAGPSGEYLIYQLANYGTTSAPKYNLQLWNSSKYQQLAFGQIGAGNWFSATPYDASKPEMYSWNVTLPSVTGQGWSIFRDVIVGDRLLLVQGNMGAGPRAISYGANITCVSIKPETAGTILWSKSYTPADGNVTRVIIAVDAVAGTFVTEDKETLELNGFSLENGNHVWTAETPVVEWDTLRRDTCSAYGNLYAAGYDGIVYCFDDKTGELKWTYGNGGVGNTTTSGSNTVYGHYPVFIDVIADGKVYIGTTEHSPDQPLYKGGMYAAVNATSGKEIWTFTGMGSGMYVGQNDLVADGYFIYLNIYDMQIYSLGKGASQTTINAPAAALSQGQSLVISGSVTDLSAGTNQEEQAARFPNGVPCVSDASMRSWMEYVYQQQNKPTDVKGVDVAITVVDANGNYRYAGTATSDASGFYSFQWTPDIVGKYTVIATFGGTNSYYGSSATSAFAVDAPAATASPIPTPAPSAADLYFIPAVIGIILAVIIGFVVIIALLMKKP